MANRPLPETDLNADFTYVDGYDGPAITEPMSARTTSQPKLFSLFRSKKSAEPTTVQPMQMTTITAGAYSGPRGPHHSSLRRQDNPPYQHGMQYQQGGPYQYQQGGPYQHGVSQQGVPALLVTAPSRPDTADFTDAEWLRAGDGRPQMNPGQPSWQTVNAVDHHSQPMYGRGAGASGGGFVANGGSQDWTPSSHRRNMDFDAVQAQSYSAVQNASPYSDGWSAAAMQREGSPRRSPRLGGGPPPRSFDDHWSAYGETAAEAEGVSWERRKSLPSIVKLPATTPTTQQNKQQASNVRSTTSNAPQNRQQVETYVIENGVRKRVRYKETPFQLKITHGQCWE